MPTFIIRHPENQEERTLVSNLIGILEKMHSLVTFDAIGIVVPEGDPETPLLRSLAWHEIKDLPVPSEQLIVDKPEANLTPDEKLVAQVDHCEECGAEFVKPQVNSRYCSKKCAQRVYSRKYHQKKANAENHKAKLVRKANGGDGFGSGVVHGKLSLGSHR